MKKFLLKHRYLVIFGSVLIQLALGAIYAWSVFTPSLQQLGWTKAQTQYVFSTGLAVFAIVMVLAGRLLPKIGPKTLAMTGGALLGIAYMLPCFWPISVLNLIMFIGVLGGIGIGLTYVVPITVGMKWYPDKKGLITGLGVAGFGFGATLWVKLAGSWGNLISHYGLCNTFIIYGLTFLVMTFIGSLFMVFPPVNWQPQGYKAAEKKASKTKSKAINFTSQEMLKTAQFFIIFATFIFSASAGLMVIGLMKIFPKEALLNNNPLLTTKEASAIAGTAMAIFFSLANGLGRIIWGIISDKIGRKSSLIIMTGSQALMMFLFPILASYQILLYLAVTIIGFNFGGNFSLFPTITADTFGSKHIGQNYGWVFLAYGVGGILGPILGGKIGDMGNFPLAFSLCGTLCLVASILSARIKHLEK